MAVVNYKPLSKEVYQAIEDIVGPKYITQDPVHLDAYAYRWASDVSREDHSPFQRRSAAVVMPASVDEIQAVVRICNKYKVKLKPFSTGWGTFSSPAMDGVISMDLRRMNRILEIDEKNMIAVVEPYVINVQLQAELIKRGLNTHMIGAGGSCSPLATATSKCGGGPDTMYMGYSAENLLGLEWVMPTGEILRTGTLGAGIGWFCGEGPGPSVRGIARGILGGSGGLGVFTKCAIKLYPWPGPPSLPIVSSTPSYSLDMPKNFRAYTVALPNWPAYADFMYKLAESEQLGYICHRQFTMLGVELGSAIYKIFIDPKKAGKYHPLDFLEETLEKPEIKQLAKESKICFQMVLAGMSDGDIQWQEKALDQICAETGGWKIAAMTSPQDPAMEKFTFMYFIRMPYKDINNIMGIFGGLHAHHGTPDFQLEYTEAAPAIKKREIARGGIVDDGGDALMGASSLIGGGGQCSLEMFFFYDPTDEASIIAAHDYDVQGVTLSVDKKLGPQFGVPFAYGEVKNPIMRKYIFECVPQGMFSWQKKVRDVFDPNQLGDGSYCVPFKAED